MNETIKLCRDKGANGTREMLDEILTNEEESVDWLETHIGMIKELGKENYLAEMM